MPMDTSSSSSAAAGARAQSAGAGRVEAGAAGNAARDAWYTFDEAKLEEVMSAKPWLQE
jgi:hypothetical protein